MCHACERSSQGDRATAREPSADGSGAQPQDILSGRAARRAAGRVSSAAVVGIPVGAAAAFFVPWQASVLIGWIAAAATYLGQVWWRVLPKDERLTAEHAMALDDSRVLADLLVLSASVSTLVAVALLLVKAGTAGGATGWYAALAVLTVVSAWAVVHTVYTLRYAELYYADDAGGLDFHGDGDPTYHDFAYLAFTIGMTFQVSDTEVTSRQFRRAILRHALLSFVLGAAIIGTTVNLVAGLRG